MKKNLLALLAALCVPCAAFALPLTSADIATLVQECPSLDQYKKTPAVIWNKKQLYTQDSRKRAVKTTSYVILCSAAAKFGWLQDQMIAPSGGEIELEQAAIFDPVTSKLIRNVAYDTGELAHGRIVLDLPPLEDDRIFVLSYRQIFPEPDVMEDLVWIVRSIPFGRAACRCASTKTASFCTSRETTLCPPLTLTMPSAATAGSTSTNPPLTA